MSKIAKIAIATLLLFTTCTNISPILLAKAPTISELKLQDPIVNPMDLQKYIDQGFSQEEVYRAALISKFSKKDVSEVLQTYKETGSWEKTAKNYNVDMKQLMKQHFKEKEQLLKTHQEEVLIVLAMVNGVTVEKLNSYMKEGISLKMLFAFSAISKNTGAPLKDLVKLKQEGATLEKIHIQAKTNRQTIHEDMRYILEEINKEIEKNHPELSKQP